MNLNPKLKLKSSLGFFSFFPNFLLGEMPQFNSWTCYRLCLLKMVRRSIITIGQYQIWAIPLRLATSRTRERTPCFTPMSSPSRSSSLRPSQRAFALITSSAREGLELCIRVTLTKMSGLALNRSQSPLKFLTRRVFRVIENGLYGQFHSHSCDNYYLILGYFL